MRKVISTLVLALILTTSCSKDESNNDEVSVSENNNEVVDENKDSETVETTEVEDENEKENVVETSAINKEVINSVIVKSDSYSGAISDIPIKMELNYYENDVVQGTYYYEKYKQNIELTGQIDANNNIFLKTYDNSEKFVGTVDDGVIWGEWISGDNALNFNVSSEAGEINEVSEASEVYTTTPGKTIVYDDDNIYYSLNNTLYKYNYEASTSLILKENQEFNNLVLYDDKIYFTGSNYDLKRINTDGSNLERLDKNYNICATGQFVIYKDRIYFADVNSMWATSNEYFKLMSSDLDGGNASETLIYSGDLNGNEKYREYYISFICDDYIYFGADMVDVRANLFRTNLDGENLETIDAMGYTIGGFDDKIYYVAEYSNDIWTRKMDPSTNKASLLYAGIEPTKNNQVVGFEAVLDGDYIVITYATESDNLFHIIVLDLYGNVINEKDMLMDGGYFNYKYIDIRVIGDEIYYTQIYTSPYMEKIKWFKIIE